MTVLKSILTKDGTKPKKHGWIGVDLDATLATYEGWQGLYRIGEPIPRMVERIKNWLADGWEVRIFTARMAGHDKRDTNLIRECIQTWLEKHGLPKLECTCVKDMAMIELWDDRARQVVPNDGRTPEEYASETGDTTTWSRT
jgi:hypothetical protein